MPRVLVRQKLAAYLNQGLAQGALGTTGTVYPNPPKITQQTDFFKLQKPGTNGGIVIYMYLSAQSETRIGVDGIHGGRKARVYELSLLAYFIWKGANAQAAGAANDNFIDKLTSWIEADRNAGTGATSLGGDGSGVIFCWGEGANPQTVGGGKDIAVHSDFPRELRGQVVQVFNVVDVAVFELLAT